MPFDPSDPYQQDEQRRLDEARLRDEERRERTRRFDDDERDERERLDRDTDREREGKGERGGQRRGWRSFFGLRRAQTDAPHVEPAIAADKPAAAPTQAPVATSSAKGGRALASAIVIGMAILVGAAVTGFTSRQRSHGPAAPGVQPLATADAAVVTQPLAPVPAGTPSTAGAPEASGTAAPVADAAPAHDEAIDAALPGLPASDPAEATQTAPAETPIRTAARQAPQQPEVTPPAAVAAIPASDAPAPDAQAAAPMVVASAAPTTPDATAPAPASAAQNAALADATNQIAALNTRVEALQAQLLALQTAQQAAKPAPAEAVSAAAPARPRKPVRKTARAAAHETPKPSAAAAREEPKLLAIDSWGGKPSVMVGIEQADGSADTRVRTLEPGDTLAGITLRSVDAEAGQAVFDVGAGRVVTLNLEPR